MNLLEQKLFFPLKNARGIAPEPMYKENGEFAEGYKEWRNEQKRPLKGNNWGSTEKYTYAEIANYQNIGMIIPPGYILVDVDDEKQAGRVHKALVSEGYLFCNSWTGKGQHFLFKDPRGNLRKKQWQNRISIAGIITDVRIPSYEGGSSGGYVVVKFFPDAKRLGNQDGFRFKKQEDLGLLSEMPSWLELTNQQTGDEFLKVVSDKWEEGSRDENLRAWTTFLWKTDTKLKKEIKTWIRIINDYIMSSPLERHEQQLFAKVDKWIKWTDEHKKVRKEIVYGDEEETFDSFSLFDLVTDIDYMGLAQHLKEIFKIAFYEGYWWIKDKKPWYEKTSDEEIIIKFITAAGNAGLKADEKKLLTALKIYTTKEKTDNEKHIINFKNGSLNIKTNILEPIVDTNFTTFGIDTDYKEDTTSNQIDEALKDWTQGHQDEIDVLMEFVGSVMYPENRGSRGIIILGKKAGNGKSTFINMMNNLFRNEFITSMSLTQLENRFGANDLIGKRLWSTAELEDTYIEKSTMFKQVIGSDDFVEVEIKNVKNKVRFKPNVKFLCSTNKFPRFGDTTNGIWRRLVILPFDFEPTKEKKNLFKESTLMNDEAKERLVFLAIKGLQRYLKNGDFTIPERSKKLEKEMRVMSNPIHAWTLDENAPKHEIMEIGLALGENFTNYQNWCRQNGYSKSILGRNKFKPELERVREDLHWEQKGKSAFMLRKLKTNEEEEIKEDLISNILNKK